MRPPQKMRGRCLCAAPAHVHPALLLLEQSLQPTPSPLCGLASWPLLCACFKPHSTPQGGLNWSNWDRSNHKKKYGPTASDEARRVEVQCRVSVRGALYLPSQLSKPLQSRYAVHIPNRNKNPGYVGAMHCCKAPLWGRRLDLDSPNLTPRFEHRLLLVMR